MREFRATECGIALATDFTMSDAIPLRGIMPDATDTLRAFLAAFNAYDLDTIMSFFADDCELDMHQPADQRSARCARSM